jgi:type II secretory pathway pseudopilin PulG
MKRRQRGIALAELLVAAVIAALVMAALGGVLASVGQTDSVLSERAVLQRDARLALARIAAMVEGSTRLMVPLEVTTGAGSVLAVALPPNLDRNGDGFADADNDHNGIADDDLPADETKDGAAGIKGIDDDGDGTVDNGSGITDNDENGTVGSTPVAPKTGADWIDPVVYRVSAGQLIERLPNINPTSGADYTERPIADKVSAFTVTRIATGNRRTREVQVQLTLTGPGGETGTWMRRLRLGTR